MSDSYSAEQNLIKLAEELEAQAANLRRAAEVLNVLRNSNEQQNSIKDAKEWAKSWMKS